MRSKPKGAKYRNLTTRSGVIYYQRRVSGKRLRFSCEKRGVGTYRGPLLALVEEVRRLREVALGREVTSGG